MTLERLIVGIVLLLGAVLYMSQGTEHRQCLAEKAAIQEQFQMAFGDSFKFSISKSVPHIIEKH